MLQTSVHTHTAQSIKDSFVLVVLKAKRKLKEMFDERLNNITQYDLDGFAYFSEKVKHLEEKYFLEEFTHLLQVAHFKFPHLHTLLQSITKEIHVRWDIQISLDKEEGKIQTIVESLEDHIIASIPESLSPVAKTELRRSIRSVLSGGIDLLKTPEEQEDIIEALTDCVCKIGRLKNMSESVAKAVYSVLKKL